MSLIPLRDGQQLHTRIIGRGQPVLMLHGMGMEGRHWLPFVLPHIHRFRFVLPDMRGAGKSRAATYNQADIFQNHADDMQDLIAHLGLNDFLLVGYSLGATTALHLQRDGGFAGVRRYLHIDQSPCVGNRADWAHGLGGENQPEFFSLLSDIHAHLSAAMQENPAAETLAELPRNIQTVIAQQLAKAFAPVFGHTPLEHLMPRIARWPWLFSRVFPLSSLADLRATLAAYLGGGHDYRASLRDSKTPVTVFIGMKSPLYAAAGQMQVAELVQTGNVVRFEKSGHVPLLNEPRKFAQEFGKFLRD